MYTSPTSIYSVTSIPTITTQTYSLPTISTMAVPPITIADVSIYDEMIPEEEEEEYHEDYEEDVLPPTSSALYNNKALPTIPDYGSLPITTTSTVGSISTTSSYSISTPTSLYNPSYTSSTYDYFTPTSKLQTIPEQSNDIYLSQTDLYTGSQYDDMGTSVGYDYTENENDFIASGDLKNTNIYQNNYQPQPILPAVTTAASSTIINQQQPQPQQSVKPQIAQSVQPSITQQEPPKKSLFGSLLNDGLNILGSNLSNIKDKASTLATAAATATANAAAPHLHQQQTNVASTTSGNVAGFGVNNTGTAFGTGVTSVTTTATNSYANQNNVGYTRPSGMLQKQETEYFDDEGDYLEHNDSYYDGTATTTSTTKNHRDYVYDAYNSYSANDDYFNEEEENRYLEEHAENDHYPTTTSKLTYDNNNLNTPKHMQSAQQQQQQQQQQKQQQQHVDYNHRHNDEDDELLLDEEDTNIYKTDNNDNFNNKVSLSSNLNDNLINNNTTSSATGSIAKTSTITTTSALNKAHLSDLPEDEYEDYYSDKPTTAVTTAGTTITTTSNNNLIRKQRSILDDELEQHDQDLLSNHMKTDSNKIVNDNLNNNKQQHVYDEDEEYLDEFDEHTVPTTVSQPISHIKKQESILEDDLELQQLEEERELRHQQQLQQQMNQISIEHEPKDQKDQKDDLLIDADVKHKKTVTICEDDITRRESTPQPPAEKRTAKQRWHWAYNKIIQQMTVSHLFCYIVFLYIDHYLWKELFMRHLNWYF